ncbi:hypothetical protein [uncultured Shewanella sp.]|uniref:hypothetical protein n=1 Tax=uncultured Shewanella sp. TaxID=173975 RepID=UPI00262E8598|nr:hypothetical protein [uncultured Shewanella sp.]
MKVFIKFFLVSLASTVAFSCLATEQTGIMVPSNLLSKGKLKAGYELSSPSAFFDDSEQASEGKRVLASHSAHDNSEPLLVSSTLLTGKLMVKLAEGVNVNDFISNYDVTLDWQSDNQLVVIAVPDNTSVNDFFALRDAINASEDVKWVEVDNKSPRYQIH